MASSFEANATTANPKPKCPFFTRSGYDAENNQYLCDYEPWAYGLFAIACLLLIMVPLLLIICCVVRNRHKRKMERRLRSTLSSNTSYSSSEIPYQPLMRESRKNYGATRNESASTSGLSPNEESISEAPSQQHDNTSTTSSKASLYPNYDQASLDNRNASAFTAPKNSELAKNSSQNSKNDISPYASTKLITDSISSSKDASSKAKSPIYAVLEEPSKEPSLSYTEEERIPSELQSPENIVTIVPGNNKKSVESNEQLPKDTDKEKKEKAERLDDLYSLPEVSYAPNKEPNSAQQEEVPSSADTESRENSPVYNVLEPPLSDVPEVNSTPQEQEEVPLSADTESRENSPVYNVLEPPLPEVPEVEKIPETVVKPLVDDHISIDDKSDNTKLSAECTNTPEAVYAPLLPPREKRSDSADNGVYQQLMPNRRERLTSRTDYEEFLLEMIKSLPEEERNGAFVVRDSVTNPGSKALTVYNKSLNSEKEVFNFKVCFDDEGQIFLAKSTKRFPSLQELLQYLRTNKDMLPCTLTSQVN